MNTKGLYTVLSARGDCLSQGIMEKYIFHNLSGKASHRVERHLLDCNLCGNAVASLTSEDFKVIRNITSGVNKKITSITGYRPDISWLGKYGFFFLLSVLLSITGIYVYNSSRENKPATHRSNNANPPLVMNDNQDIIENNSGQDVQTKEPVQSSKESAYNTNNKEKRLESIRKKDESTGENMTNHAVANIEEKQDKKEKPRLLPSIVNKKDINEPEEPIVKQRNMNDISLTNITVKVIDKTSILKESSSSSKTPRNGEIGSIRKTKEVRGNFMLDEMPEFRGGDPALEGYLSEKVSAIIKEKGKFDKKTYVSFVVDSKGRIDEVDVEDVPQELKEDVKKAMFDMPDWNPSKKKGKIRCTIAITFE